MENMHTDVSMLGVKYRFFFLSEAAFFPPSPELLRHFVFLSLPSGLRSVFDNQDLLPLLSIEYSLATRGIFLLQILQVQEEIK